MNDLGQALQVWRRGKSPDQQTISPDGHDTGPVAPKDRRGSLPVPTELCDGRPPGRGCRDHRHDGPELLDWLENRGEVLPAELSVLDGLQTASSYLAEARLKEVEHTIQLGGNT